MISAVSRVQHWPLGSSRVMAWTPPETMPSLGAIPLTLDDPQNGLSPAMYRLRLAARVLWMIKREDDPEEAIEALRMALETRDLWPGTELQAAAPWGQVQEMLVDNPAWPDFLNLQVQLPDERPMKVRQMPAAVQAVRETAFPEWMDLAFAAEPMST